MTTPDSLTAGSGKTVLIPAGSVTRSEYVSPLTGVKENRPRPSCSVRNVATSFPAAVHDDAGHIGRLLRWRSAFKIDAVRQARDQIAAFGIDCQVQRLQEEWEWSWWPSPPCRHPE